jgi:hypothetical protein
VCDLACDWAGVSAEAADVVTVVAAIVATTAAIVVATDFDVIVVVDFAAAATAAVDALIAYVCVRVRDEGPWDQLTSKAQQFKRLH